MVKEQKRSTFFIRNLFRGLLWLGIILFLFVFLKKHTDVNFIKWLEPVYNNQLLVYLIFLFSEVIFGIIPPEVFFIWALRFNDLLTYIGIVAFLSVISYLSGLTGYFIGRYLSKTLFFRFFRRKFLSKSEKLLNIYGLYLIIVAATTPLPFSGVSMLVGSVRYPVKKYILYSLSRFGRFAVSAWLVWQTNMLS